MPAFNAGGIVDVQLLLSFIMCLMPHNPVDRQRPVDQTSLVNLEPSMIPRRRISQVVNSSHLGDDGANTVKPRVTLIRGDV